MRIKSKWHKKRPKTPEDLASATGFIGWRLATHHVDEIEAAGFDIETQQQRFDILREFLIFLIQAADRIVHTRLSDDDRSRFITALALHMAGTLEDNLRDYQGSGEYRRAFIERLNQEIPDYAELAYGEDGPGYRFLRYFGEKVLAIVGVKDANRWVIDQVMDVEAPAAIKSLTKTMDDLMSVPDAPDDAPVPS